MNDSETERVDVRKSPTGGAKREEEKFSNFLSAVLPRAIGGDKDRALRCGDIACSLKRFSSVFGTIQAAIMFSNMKRESAGGRYMYGRRSGLIRLPPKAMTCCICWRLRKRLSFSACAIRKAGATSAPAPASTTKASKA